MEEQILNIESDVTFDAGIGIHPFLFDMVYSVGIEGIKPWEDPIPSIALILDRWEQSEEQIANLFSLRKRNEALEPMKQQICSFIAILFWLNKQPVRSMKNLKDEMSKLERKPVNVCERVEYILSAPNHHHSFTQLKQLFIELKKKIFNPQIKK